MKPLLALAFALLASPPCLAQAPQDSRPTGPRPWDAPDLARAISVLDGRTGEALTFAALLDALATADVVFLGETHIDETTHRVELAVAEGLAVRRSGDVVLAMEMFDRDVQDALDAYLAGNSSEPDFLAASRPWTNYATGYRPLIEFAKSRRLPVVASNFPKSLTRRLAMAGDGATLDLLEGEDRALAPKRLYPNRPDYWRRVDNAIRGHIGMMRVDRDDDERLYSTQSLWDNSMGEACAIALDEHPGSSVLHVNGGFHSAYWDGTVRQLRLRKPNAKILTVSIAPTSNPGVADAGDVPVADYVVYTEARATDLNEGTYSVHVQREIEYRFHLPASARSGRDVPLLLWLADDGFTAEDGMALWRSRLGDECAIAVVEAPYRETRDDLVEGGRWFWPDSFASDLGTMEVAIERIWAYLLRHYPIAPGQVCLAGEGTGATVAAAVSLSNDRISARTVSFSPRRFAKLKDIPLPLPEYRGDVSALEKSLRVFLTVENEAWWSRETAEYRAIGFETEMVMATRDPWSSPAEREDALRVALGLEAARKATDAPRRHIIARTPRARFWARLLGDEVAKKDGALVAVLDAPPSDGSSVAIEIGADPEEYVRGRSLPRCPGPFGGTTVLVVPPSAPREIAEAWLALEATDPLNRNSRFHRLRVVTTGGDRDLPAVLTELVGEGRRNVLVVPAVFCADGDTMRRLRRAARDIEDQMTLRWRPGLGG